jgi:outer membrane protein insertion porin family
MRRVLLCGFTLAAAFSFAPTALAQRAARPAAKAAKASAIPRISSVKVAGNRRIEGDAVLERMKIKAGSEAAPEQVAADIRAIFALGYFEDVRMELDAGLLTVRVRERPVVTEIVYEGSEEFQPKDLEEATGLKPFNVLSLDRVRQAQEAIVKKYEEKGYYLAQAPFELTPIPKREQEVRLTFKVEENEKVVIRKIFFLGNKVYPSGDLKRIMLTAEGHVFSWASGGGTYREAAFERDLQALAYFYGNEGYIEAKFGKPRVSLSQDRKYIDVFMDVAEGEQHFLGDVKFRGDDLFTSDELREAFEMDEGDVFSTGKLQEQILALTDKFGDKGYAFANVIPRTVVRPGTKIVDLAIDIEKGEKVYWGKISVTGNTKTHDKVVRRELVFFEGELYNATKRKKSVERVRRLGFFGNEVAFLTSSPEGKTDILDMEIKVAEKPSGTLMIQAGYGNVAGFSLGAQIAQNNLFGLGQQLSFNLNIAKETKTFNLGFTDPKIFDSEWLAGIDLYVQESSRGGSRSTYSQRLEGGALRVGREIYEDLSLYGTYKLEHSELKDPVSPDIFTTPEDADSLISSVTTTLAYDKRNNRADPTGGYYMSGSAELAGLGGRVFQKFLANARYYNQFFGNVTWRTQVEYGYLTNLMNDETVPDSERFLLGGVFSLRGYPLSSVGPTRRVRPTGKDADGDPLPPFNYPIGGTHKFLYVNELEMPLIPDADIRIAAFFDVGNAWDDAFSGSPAVLSNYGWGLRWYSPLGPLRFEWGYPLTLGGAKGNLGSEFHFIIAPTF